MTSAANAEPKPRIATNSPGKSVAAALNGFIEGATSGLSGEVGLDIATAYFNVGGYAELCDALDGVACVRLLLGAEPDDARKPRVLSGEKPESLWPASAEKDKIERALKGLEQTLTFDRNLLGFTYEADQTAKRLVEWLSPDKKGSNSKVEVRLLRERFLHGKAYLISTLGHGVVAGSSNFTRAGLTSNVELNLGNYDPGIVREAQDWFDENWEIAEPYDLAALFQQRFNPHNPQLIYLRMLAEWSSSEQHGAEQVDPTLDLTTFQLHGLWRARRILEEYSGVLIADEVGLGKTFLAGELIADATLKRRQRALVIAPATLRDGTWRAFKAANNLNVELRSFNELAADKRLNPDGKHSTEPKLLANPNEYSLIVIDEAHNARSTSTQLAGALRQLLSGTPRKQLVMMTATPVNNSLWDLYNLLVLFLANDAVFADTGINSLRDHFKWAMQQDPDDLSPQHLFDVLDPVTVRRTRKFIKRHYRDATYTVDGEQQRITFPTPRVTRVDYDFDAVLPGFFERFAAALDSDNKASSKSGTESLKLARYTPSKYLRMGAVATYETQHAGLLQSALLKRFESSPKAFANTCETMVKAHDAFLSLMNEGYVATGEALADWVATDSDDIDKVDDFLEHRADLLDDINLYDQKALREAVESDRDLLQDFADTASTVEPSDDPTLKAIVEELAKIAKDAAKDGITDEDKRDRRKVLIFSYFADTVSWVYDHLAEVVQTDKRLAAYRGRLASISGTSGESDADDGSINKDDVLWGFAPRTMEAPQGFDEDKYDIVVATDVLSEGVNLQQARHIINYDLPWNPMRLVQRHGRIDRIGSSHSEVFIRCVFPDKKLGELLGLEERIKRKLRHAAVAVGVESDVIPDEPGAERVFTERREEIEQLRREEAGLFEQGGRGQAGISGEEFRRELAEALQDSGIRSQVETLPWGSGSGMQTDLDSLAGTANAGFVFCVRVGNHKKVLFRYVEVDSSGKVVSTYIDRAVGQRTGTDAEENVERVGVISDTLECLANARPTDGWETERVLAEETQQLAYAAWAATAEEILSTWNKSSDPKAFTRSLDKAQRDATAILRDSPPGDIDDDAVKEAIDKIEAPLAPNRVNAIRNAVRSHPNDPVATAKVILEVVEQLGLERYKPPPPLPEITADDIHLVCWLALTPST